MRSVLPLLLALLFMLLVVHYCHASGLVTAPGSGGGGAGTGDITDVFSCPSGDCNLVHVQDGESLDYTGTGTITATTAAALAANPSDCAVNTYATTIAANGNLTCASVTYAQLTGTVTDCAAGTFVKGIDAGTVLDCATPAGGGPGAGTPYQNAYWSGAATLGSAVFDQYIMGASGINAQEFSNAAGTPVRVEIWPQATDKPDEGAAATSGTIAWAEAQLTGGGEIFLHAGTYTVGTTIVMDVAGTTLRCADPQTTTLKAKTNLNSTMLQVGDFVGTTQKQGMQVMGCGFDGNTANQSTSGTILALKNTADARVEGNYIRYWKTLGMTMGCSASGTVCVDNMVARNNFFSSGGSGNTSGAALWLDSAGSSTRLSDGRIVQNDIGGDNSNGDRVSGWIKLGDGTNAESTNGWSIQGNHVYGADRGACIEIVDLSSSLLDISNNTLESCNVGAIKWKGNSLGEGGLSNVQNNKMYGFTGRCSAGTNPIGTQCAVATAVADCGAGGVCTLPNVFDFDRVLRNTVTGNRFQSQAGGVSAFIVLRDSGALGGSNHNLIADNKMDWTGVSGEKGITLANSSANNTIEGNQCRTNTGGNGTCVDGGSIAGNRFFSNSCVNTCAALEAAGTIPAYSATTIHDVNTSVGDVGDFTCTTGACTIDAGVVTSGKVDSSVCASSGTGCPPLYNRVQEEGANLTQRATINFIGSSITCADNAGSTRTDCTVTDANTTAHGALTGLANDDHTQYLLLAGRAGGQSANGGTAASENLTLLSTANATKGSIFFGSEWKWTEDSVDASDDGVSVGTTTAGGLWNPTISITGQTGPTSNTRGIYLNPTLNYNDAAGVVINNFKAIEGAGTFTVSGAATQASSWTLFDATATLDATVAAKVPPTPTTFHAAPTIRYSATSGTGNMTGSQIAFQDASTYRNVDAGGTFTVNAPTSFQSNLTFTKTAGVLNITTGRGFWFANPTVTNAPTVTTLIGVDIEKPTRATAPGNIGLRNGGTTVYTSTAQAIAAASDTITCSATFMLLTTIAGTTTLTANPIVADGQTGQVCTLSNNDVTAADCLVFTDATQGLQLAGNFTMCPNDTLTLQYNGTDWIEIARSDADNSEPRTACVAIDNIATTMLRRYWIVPGTGAKITAVSCVYGDLDGSAACTGTAPTVQWTNQAGTLLTGTGISCTATGTWTASTGTLTTGELLTLDVVTAPDTDCDIVACAQYSF